MDQDPRAAMVKKDIYMLALGALVMAVLFLYLGKRQRDDFNESIEIRQRFIVEQQDLICTLKKRLKLDSLAYEKEREQIAKLRNRYPDDVLLDSLFRAGQNLR